MWLTLWRIFLRMCNVQYLLNNFDSWQLGVYSQSPRELNRKIFPILTASQISEDFYEDFLEDDLGFAILAYYGDMLVSMYRRMTWGSPSSHTMGICWSVHALLYNWTKVSTVFLYLTKLYVTNSFAKASSVTYIEKHTHFFYKNAEYSRD